MPEHDDKCQTDEFDTPWKEILRLYFREFLAFFLPEAHEDIHWERGYEFLDSELSSIAREAKIGDRRVDKLVKVWRHHGDAFWVLIHVEIQGNRDSKYSARMYTYHYRAYDLQQMPVVSLAILADEESHWRPSEYSHALWGTQVHFKFNAVKLLDFAERQADLEKSTNPFAIVTLAHLQAKKTRNQMEARSQVKWQLIRGLYQSGFNRQQVIDLFRFIDWVLHLPKEADERLRTKIVEFEESQKMPYISSVERLGEERGEKRGEERGEERGEKRGEERGEKRGRKQGEATILTRQLQRRFGDLPVWVSEKIAKAEPPSLEEWCLRILDTPTLDGIFAD